MIKPGPPMLFELINIGVKQYYDTRGKTYYLAFSWLMLVENLEKWLNL